MESWRDLGPSRGPSERPGGLGIDFLLILGSISEGILELKFMKILKKKDFGCVKPPQITEHAFGWLPTLAFDRFWIHFTSFS